MKIVYHGTVIEDGGEARVHDFEFHFRNVPDSWPHQGETVRLWKADPSLLMEVKRVIHEPLYPEVEIHLGAVHIPHTKYSAFLEMIRTEYSGTVDLVDPC